MKEKTGKKKMPVFLKIIIIVLAVFIGVMIAVLIVSPGSDEPTTGGETQANQQTGKNEPAPTENKPAESQILVDNEFVKVTYEKIFDDSSLEGMTFLQLKYENKTDGKIWVYLKDSSVNGEMIQFGSGVPTYIEAGKLSRNPVTFKYNKNDVKEMEFKIVVNNMDTNEDLCVSEPITVKIK